MVEAPSCVIISRVDQRTTDHNHHHHHQVSRTTTTTRDDDDDVNGCSGQSCSSCTASCVADCVAVCCCPCAIVNLLVLAFVKVPCLMGKRCVRLVRDKGRESLRKKKKKKKSIENKDCFGAEIDEKRMGTSCDEENSENRNEMIVVEKEEKLCARYEAEKVCWELYQVGHWGFGRISCSGTPG